MIISIQQPEYFPWIGYFDKISQVDKVILLDNVQFKKRYFENRNKVRTPQGWCWIRTPVLVKGRFTQRICDVCIDSTSDWQRNIVQTLRHNYGKAPHWRDYGEALCSMITDFRGERLVDFNHAVISFLLVAFGLNKVLLRTSELGTTKSSSELIMEICKIVGADAYLSGRDGRNYLDENAFQAAGIKIKYQEFVHPSYSQCQSGDFVPGLSAVDLLFNIGQAGSELFTQQT
ncbi:MAG: WbqC family protein [Alphaproteobacteria bacterium]|nr:WbqC family protein [Alphaproteobacteria bacterium]